MGREQEVAESPVRSAEQSQSSSGLDAHRMPERTASDSAQRTDNLVREGQLPELDLGADADASDGGAEQEQAEAPRRETLSTKSLPDGAIQRVEKDNLTGENVTTTWQTNGDVRMENSLGYRQWHADGSHEIGDTSGNSYKVSPDGTRTYTFNQGAAKVELDDGTLVGSDENVTVQYKIHGDRATITASNGDVPIELRRDNTAAGVVWRTEDGSMSIEERNDGSVRLAVDDEFESVHERSGAIEQRLPGQVSGVRTDGTVYVRDAGSDARQVDIGADGTLTKTLPDGTVERNRRDNTVEITRPDGSTEVRPLVVALPDGTPLGKPQGSAPFMHVRLPSGDQYVLSADKNGNLLYGAGDAQGPLVADEWTRRHLQDRLAVSTPRGNPPDFEEIRKSLE